MAWTGINNSSVRWLAVNNILGSQQSRDGNYETGTAPHYLGARAFEADPMIAKDFVTDTGAVKPLILREPRLNDSGYYQSIAQLQHAPLSDFANNPLYALGNSLQNPRIVDRDSTYKRVSTNLPLFDLSYLLNQALWDKYFFSTVPDSPDSPTPLTDANLADPNYRLPNARILPLSTATETSLKGHNTAASQLLLLGGFNINSTSEQAWRAVLAAAQELRFNPKRDVRDQSKTLRSPFSRFLAPPGDSVTSASATVADLNVYQGYRELSDAQIAALAAAIVAEVKARGPFRSLADFVNRRLVPTTDGAAPTGLKGALQAAIDAVDTQTPPVAPINAIAPYAEGGSSLSGSTGGDAQAQRGVVGSAIAPISSRSAFGPGYLTQADVLSRIGSAISARSDSFVIRTYGEARNPATQEVTARAWAETVVQRMPEFVDPSDAPETALASLSLGSVNAVFGRRFKVVSFRWLGPNEI
jgi:hypothetical protein